MDGFNKTFKRKIVAWYGNRAWTFDVFVAFSLTVVGFEVATRLGVYPTSSLTVDFLYNLTSFFGVLAGFLLTAFSLLYLYNPSQGKMENNGKNSVFMAFRNSPLFVNVLKAFPHAIALTILFVLSVYIGIALSVDAKWYEEIVVFLLLLSSLRIFRCLYLMIAVIDISNAPSKSD